VYIRVCSRNPPTLLHTTRIVFIHAVSCATAALTVSLNPDCRYMRTQDSGVPRTLVCDAAVLVHVHARTKRVKLGGTESVPHSHQQVLEIAQAHEARLRRV
jgi:hypothetical protein